MYVIMIVVYLWIIHMESLAKEYCLLTLIQPMKRQLFSPSIDRIQHQLHS